MADTKLSALTELAVTPADTDEVYIRDVSEAAADESKRITIANLLAGAGGATLTVAETEVFSGNSPGSSAWTDLDLSGTTGANVALVLLKVAGGLSAVAFRKNGDTDDFYSAGLSDVAAGVALANDGYGKHAAVWVATDSTGKIEWMAEATNQVCTIDIIAYIK